MIKPDKISKVEQAKNLLYLFKGFLFVNSYILPFIFVTLNLIGFGIFYHLLINLKVNCEYTHPEWLNHFNSVLKQICDIGLLGLICLLLVNYNWRKHTWAAYIILCYMWAVNTVFQFILPYRYECKDFIITGNYFCFIIALQIPFYILLSVKWLINKN